MGSARSDENKDPDFRREVADAEPLRQKKRVAAPRGAPPVPKQRLLDERAVLAESLAPLSIDDALESGTELTYLRAGYPKDLLRKLRRGHWVVQGELDLHGMNRQQALLHTNEFLRQNQKRGTRCVRIIHGKGRGSHQREPVLKGLLRKWLVRADVLAFSQAPANQGGSGAVLVLLRS